MPAIQRVSDVNNAGAPILRGITSVRVNSRAVAVNGSPVAPHGKGIHSSSQTAGGVSSVRVEGVPLNVDGNADTCGHSRINGSADTRAG